MKCVYLIVCLVLCLSQKLLKSKQKEAPTFVIFVSFLSFIQSKGLYTKLIQETPLNIWQEEEGRAGGGGVSCFCQLSASTQHPSGRDS